MDREFGLLSRFEVAVASHRVGELKPEEPIFRILLAELQLPPEQVLFLDDHPLNVEAALRIGMNAACVQRVDGARSALREFRISIPE
jgi:putative hydrolase of the HAD superfamily